MLQITPQNNTIEFQLQIENASIENTSTRLIVNTENENIITPISIDNEGNCKGIIPLKEEWDGKTGDIKIEVITEGNYFEPFSKKVIFNSIPKTPKAKIEEIILSPSKLPQENRTQPTITESKEIKNKKPIFNPKQKVSKKPKITESKKIVKSKPILSQETKPILETKKPEVKIDKDISKEIKSFFLENQNKSIIKENKQIKKKDIGENISKEVENFFKSN